MKNCKGRSRFTKRLLYSLATLAVLIITSSAIAQQTVTGQVKDKDGNPLAAATVAVKNKKVNTVTDADGRFTVVASPGDILHVSSIGYGDVEVKLGNQATIVIELTIKVSSMEDVIVVGYGSQKKKDLTGSIVNINTNETKKYSTSDISQLLQGRATGVEVNSDGQPGAVPSVRIRGYSTFGNAQPFYVVDGVPGVTIRDFSPNDIESITVLKDASAGAIYGANSANGVIIITTKQGRKNTAMQVEYNGYYGWDKVWQILDVTDRVQYQTLSNESRTNAGLPLFPANNPADPRFVNNINTDWQKEGLKTGNRQNHNISMSGGGANSTYNVSLDYFDNKGTYVGNGPTYTRYTARVNTSAEKGIFKMGESFNYTHSHENSLTFRDDILLGGIPPLIGSLVVAIPTMPVYDAANLGGYGGSNSEFNGANSLNGIGINNILTNYVDVDRTFGNIYGELRFLKLTRQDIRFRTSLSYDKTTIRDFIWQPAFFLGKFFSQDIARLNDNSRVFTNSAIENTLTYDKIIHKHVLTVLLGQSYRQGNSLLRESHAEGFTMPYYPEISNGTTKSAKGAEFKNTLVSFFGRINYSYDDRYLLIATIRRDGSSRFSPDNKYGNFPSASAGWKISNEKFWKVSKSIVTSLKLRGSYGLLGNQNIGDYLYFGSINSGVVYTFDGVRVVGGLQTQIASPNVKWESKATTNIGFDGSFLNGALDLSAEYYSAKSEDILVNLPIPASVGYTNSNPVANAASLKNSGIEISAAYHKTRGKFTFDISANFSTLKNEVVGLGGHEEPIYGVGAKTELGGIVGEHYGFVYEGIFQTQAEIAAHATQFGAALKPGDVKYKDISGPLGKPDGVVNEAYDRTYLGSGIPKYYYGLSFTAAYRRFDLIVFVSGAANFKINSRLYRDLHHSAGSLNYSTDMLNRWTPSNTNTNIPRLNDADVNNFKDSDRPGWLQSGTYLRINTVSIGYNFPGDIIKGLSKSRVFVTGQNLYTFQKYTSYNPDFTSGVFNPGFDFGSYPKPRTLMVGVQLIF
ncbi:MAG TPA: TonB-dependent receptor [Chitinophagaceae bacterium]|nr:TonB-dependent receptor [Chitinophagaceae bacterium]